MWDMCLNLLMPATDQLRKKLSISELDFRRIAYTANGKSREVYFYRSLDEVQKACIALMHWMEFFQDLEKAPNSETHISRVVMEETIDNQSLRFRKMVELLVELILFQNTDNEAYYQDYLLIRDLNEHADSQRDRSEFYGHENRNTADSMKFYFDRIRANETNIDPTKRWYIVQPEASKPNWLTRGVRLSTFKARYSQAIKIGDPSELIILGKSYLHAYGVSKDIHFSPNNTSSAFSVEDALLLADRCILIAMQALVRIAKLMDACGEKFVQNLMAVNRLDDTNLNLVGELSVAHHVIGDYVIAHGDPARVIATKKSDHGFYAYNVIYIGRPPIPHIHSDWFAAFEVRSFVKKAQVESKINAMLAALTSEAKPLINRLYEPKEWLKQLDAGALATWQAYRAGKLKPPTKPVQSAVSQQGQAADC